MERERWKLLSQCSVAWRNYVRSPVCARPTSGAICPCSLHIDTSYIRVHSALFSVSCSKSQGFLLFGPLTLYENTECATLLEMWQHR
jgi:hypothetical protein